MVAETAGMLGNDDEELIVPDVPLAQIEDDDEQLSNDFTIKSKNSSPNPQHKHLNGLSEREDDEVVHNGFRQNSTSPADDVNSFSVSLENLVETFDQKITTVLKNLDENTTQMAPVQVRSQDEVMSESQVWWTLTGNYGNLPPLDFSKTQIRKNQIDALNLQSPKSSCRTGGDGSSNMSDAGYECDTHEEEELRDSLDLHQLISEHIHVEGDVPPISAEQVIEEIDEMMQACDLMRSMTVTERTGESSVDSMYSSMKSPFTTSTMQANDSEFKLKHNAALSLTGDELSSLPQSKLLTISTEMEHMIQAYNMNLVNELAQRDELEYEKEVKNKFITLLVNIQEQRRKMIGEAKRRSGVKPNSQLATTSIPYDESQNIVHISTLESLIKILEAIHEDSPTLPNLLTEYILTVVCPSTTTSISA